MRKNFVASKKVLHFIESEGVYGAESVLLNLSREMEKTPEYDPIVGCIVSRVSQKSCLFDKALEIGIPAQKFVLRNHWVLPDLPRVAKQVERLGIDLIHSHGYKPSVFGFLISLLTGIPIMATCHLWFMNARLPIKMRIMIRLELFLYRFFPIIVAVSEPIKKILRAKGIPDHKVRIINNGIVLSDYGKNNADRADRLKHTLDLGKGDVCVLNVGRLSRQKAQWQIISAADRLRKCCNGRLRFFIVGEGPLRAEFQNQIESHDLQSFVHLLGFRDDVGDLLQVADIFLLPSLDEGMPMALLEAMASLTPVITTPVGDIPKLIEHNHNGLIIGVNNFDDLLERIREIAESDGLRQRLAQRALETIKQSYSSEKMYCEYKRLYENILA